MNFYLPSGILSIYIGFQECRIITIIYLHTAKLRNTLYLQFSISCDGTPFKRRQGGLSFEIS